MIDVRAETDIEQLRRVARMMQIQIGHLVEMLARKCSEVDELSGKKGDLQTTLKLLEALHAEASARDADGEGELPAKKKRRRKPDQPGHGPTEQPKIERVQRLFELDEPDKTCSSCGGQLEPLEGQYETSEMVDVVEIRYQLVEVQRQKYVCRCGGCVETALGPERALPGGRYSLAFAVKAAIDKYLDHLPLARQARIMRRHGLRVTAQTLWDQLWSICRELTPAYDALYREALSGPVVGLDQTGWPNLEKKSAKKWQMWCLATESVVYHRICDDKGTATFVDLLQNYAGYVVCDQLTTHGAGARASPSVVLAGCWAHIYRRFREAEPDHPEAMIARGYIKELYEIDQSAEDETARKGLRATKSQKVLNDLHEWLKAQPALKTTSIGEAIRHTLAYWPRLERFVEHPAIWLDNNPTERALRGPVVGRRNHFGSKSRRGTQVAAIFYSLLETAKLRGVDPAAYLIAAVKAARLDQVLLPGDDPDP